MRHESWMQRAHWLLLMVVLLTTGAIAQVRAQDDERPARPDRPPRPERPMPPPGGPPHPEHGPYWAGIVVGPLDEEQREELKLDEDEGVVVDRVAPDSPAEEAGIKRNDILLTADDEPLESIRDLMEAVQESEGEPIELKVLRGDEKLTIELKPARRPGGPGRGPGGPGGPGGPDGPFQVPLPPPGDITIRPGDFPQQVWRMIRPGLPLDVKFPDDLSISIEKKGNEPGKVAVKRGEKSWDVTDDKLGELPDEVRGYVELYLGKIPNPPLPPEVEESLARGLPIPLPPGLPGELVDRLRSERRHVERRVDEEALPRVRDMQDRLEALERRLQERLEQIEKRLEDETEESEERSAPQT